MSKFLNFLNSLAALVIAVALTVLAFQADKHSQPTQLNSAYQAIVLMNGQLFFGKVEGLGNDYVVLQDVFYIQSRQKPGTTEVANVLIKRGKEAHAPDRMIINRQQIVLIEPVTENSSIAKLIAEQNLQGPT